MGEPFSGRVDVGRPLRDLMTLFFMLLLGVVLRVIDVIVLLPTPSLLRAYLAIVRGAVTHSPFREGGFRRTHVARRAKQSVGELVYGETPIVTALSLFRSAKMDATSTLIDLGAGRGRVLIAARRMGATAIGVELVPDHLDVVGPTVAETGAALIVGDAATTSLSAATHIFLTWTCLSEVTRARIQTNLNTVAPGTLVFTVTFPIDAPEFETVLHRRPFFSWGRADVYLARRREPQSAPAS